MSEGRICDVCESRTHASYNCPHDTSFLRYEVRADDAGFGVYDKHLGGVLPGSRTADETTACAMARKLNREDLQS